MHTRERKRKEDEESKMKANSNSSDTMKVKRAFSKKPPKLIMALGITLVAAILVIAGVIFYQKCITKIVGTKTLSLMMLMFLDRH